MVIVLSDSQDYFKMRLTFCEYYSKMICGFHDSFLWVVTLTKKEIVSLFALFAQLRNFKATSSFKTLQGEETCQLLSIKKNVPVAENVWTRARWKRSH